MPSNHLLLPSIFPSIRVFSSESALHIRWPKYWSFSLSISPSSEYSGLISLQSKGLWRVFSSTTIRKHPTKDIRVLQSKSSKGTLGQGSVFSYYVECTMHPIYIYIYFFFLSVSLDGSYWTKHNLLLVTASFCHYCSGLTECRGLFPLKHSRLLGSWVFLTALEPQLPSEN